MNRSHDGFRIKLFTPTVSLCSAT